MATLIAMVCVASCLLCSTQADTALKVPTSKYQPGRVSYFNLWSQLSDDVNSIQALKTNVTHKEQVEDFLSDLAAFTSVLHVHKSSGPRRHKVLSDQYTAWLEGLADAVFKKQNPRLAQSQCINDTGRMIVGLFQHQKWAAQMLDSIGKPGPSLTEGRLKWVGNYDQCREAYAPPDPAAGSVGFTGNYVWIVLYIKSIQMYWGTCFPSTCEDWQIYLLANDTKTALNMSQSAILGMPSIITDEREFTAATNVSIVVLCFIGYMMAMGTIYDIFYVQKPIWDAKKRPDKSSEAKSDFPVGNTVSERHINNGAVQNGHAAPNSVADEKLPLINRPKEPAELRPLFKALIAFSVYTNASKFLNTSQAPGSLSSIHGIRFLSMSWVILGHIYFFGMNYVANLDEQPTFLKRWTFTAVSNAFPSVDSFFTLSGLLTAYLAVKEIKKRGLKINWGLFYFHRFWRLTPPYMLTLLLVLGLQRFMASGALWSNTQPADKSNCEDNWWTNLLYVNNVVNQDKGCFGHSWYLANDMQFFVLSPLMIIPFYFKVSAGLASCLLFLVVHWIVTGVKSTQGEWPLSPFGLGPEFANAADYSKHYYFTPWCRIGPYVVGLAVGGLLATKSIRLSRMTNLIGWVVAAAMGLSVVYGAFGDISGKTESSVATRAFYNAMSRSAWGACVCWVIVSCTHGYGGFINSLLSWSPFVSLGRLTYMAYLIHPCILNVYYGNMDQLYYANNFNIIISYLGVLVLVNMIAFLLMLGLESPMIGLEKALLPRPKD